MRALRRAVDQGVRNPVTLDRLVNAGLDHRHRRRPADGRRHHRPRLGPSASFDPGAPRPLLAPGGAEQRRRGVASSAWSTTEAQPTLDRFRGTDDGRPAPRRRPGAGAQRLRRHGSGRAGRATTSPRPGSGRRARARPSASTSPRRSSATSPAARPRPTLVARYLDPGARLELVDGPLGGRRRRRDRQRLRRRARHAAPGGPVDDRHHHGATTTTTSAGPSSSVTSSTTSTTRRGLRARGARRGSTADLGTPRRDVPDSRGHGRLPPLCRRRRAPGGGPVKGIVLAGGRATRLSPASRATSKQLMHVYDKPLIYYPISTLLHARINEILVISTPEQLPAVRGAPRRRQPVGLLVQLRRAAGAERHRGGVPDRRRLHRRRRRGPRARRQHLLRRRASASSCSSTREPKGAVVFGLWVPDPERYGVLELDDAGQVVGVHEKPADPPSNLMIPGLYFYDNSVVEVAGVDRAQRPWRARDQRGQQPASCGRAGSRSASSRSRRSGSTSAPSTPCSTPRRGSPASSAARACSSARPSRRPTARASSPPTSSASLAAAADQAGDLAKSGYGEQLLRFLEFEDGLSHGRDRRLRRRAHRDRRAGPPHDEAGHRRARHGPRVLPGVRLRGRGPARRSGPGCRSTSPRPIGAACGASTRRTCTSSSPWWRGRPSPPTSTCARRRPPTAPSSPPPSRPGSQVLVPERRRQRLPGHR